jgi:aryl-alcohol dehydrogenase-like predicted oxidoreductase
MSHADIASDLDESLARLDLDAIDLYWLHRDAVTVPVEEIVHTMDEFVRAGKIRYWGVSNWKPERIHAANLYARLHGLAEIVANQPLGSFAKPNMDAIADKTLVALDDDGLEFHRKNNLPVVPYTSQAKGYFTKRAENRLGSADRELYDNLTNDRRFERVQELAGQYGTSITAIALAYLTSQSFPCAPVIGPRNMAQLCDSLSAADLTLTDEDIAYLEVNE